MLYNHIPKIRVFKQLTHIREEIKRSKFDEAFYVTFNKLATIPC